MTRLIGKDFFIGPRDVCVLGVSGPFASLGSRNRGPSEKGDKLARAKKRAGSRRSEVSYQLSKTAF